MDQENRDDLEKQAEEAELQTIRRLAALLPEVSGQLRSGLSSLYLAAAQLAPPEARELDPELDARAALLDQSYYRLLRLANNLSAAGYLADDKPFPLQDKNLPALVEEICSKAGGVTPFLKLNLQFRCARPRHICAVNAQGIEQFLYQTLSNAFKFTPPGGSVTVELAVEQGWVRLSVADTGPGIDDDKMAAIHSYYLQKDRPGPPPHGLGLGLALCWRIATGHGGRLMAENQPGGGSRFTLSFPDRKAGAGVSDAPFDYAGGFNRTLLALADALPREAFLIRNRG